MKIASLIKFHLFFQFGCFMLPKEILIYVDLQYYLNFDNEKPCFWITN